MRARLCRLSSNTAVAAVTFVFAVGATITMFTGCVADPPMPADTAMIESVGVLAGAGRQGSALRQLERWSELGSVIATRELALAYQHYPERAASARAALKQAARSGDSVAAFMLGESAHRQATSPVDLHTAWCWYEMAAERNHAEAALMLGRMAANGEGHSVDVELSMAWLERAARLHNPQAMFLLFSYFTRAEAGEAQWPRARDLLDASADRHYPPAMHAMALALETGQFGFERSATQAALLMKEASEESRNRWGAR